MKKINDIMNLHSQFIKCNQYVQSNIYTLFRQMIMACGMNREGAYSLIQHPHIKEGCPEEGDWE